MKHRQASKTTHYHYTAHRLDSVSYDDALSTVYHYNAYGQPDSVYDESGVMCYEYGNMGEVTRETRIYALPFLSQPLALSTLFEYDSWGRILNLNSTNKCKLSRTRILSSKGKQIFFNGFSFCRRLYYN